MCYCMADNSLLERFFDDKEQTKNDKSKIELDFFDEIEYRRIINKKYSFKEAIALLDEINWDFKDFKTQYLSHKIHSYPARFIPQIPLTFIKLFTSSGDTILDPFSGGGTTVVEAFLNNRNSIGIDYNPLFLLIADAITNFLAPDELREIILIIEKRVSDIKLETTDVQSRINRLPKRKEAKIFSFKLIRLIEKIKKIANDIEDENKSEYSTLIKIALSSAIFTLIENGEKNVKTVIESYLFKLFNNNIRNFGKIQIETSKKLDYKKQNIKILRGDSRKIPKSIVKDQSIDLIVTSPPYVNALDYYRIHQFNMFVLDYNIKEFKDNEVGGHSHFINNRFRLLSEYLGDMTRSMIEMNRVLKNNKLCVIVIGNSSLEFELVESYKYFISIGEQIGYKHLKTINRNIDKTKKHYSAIGKIDDEYIIVFQKESNCQISSDNENKIADIVKEQMIRFRSQIMRVQGTSITTPKKPTEQRLKDNINRIREAIETIPKDIKYDHRIQPEIISK